ncbi:hypothetical protein HMPREF9996_02065 [Aggregatibacter actinomycetemcomitans Y4]|nr:hypothetical protein HMPREF9996_02065 [Aggregatibacter actinomycetemcomitans Y4]
MLKNKERNCNHKFDARQMRFRKNPAIRLISHHSQHLEAKELYGFG